MSLFSFKAILLVCGALIVTALVVFSLIPRVSFGLMCGGAGWGTPYLIKQKPFSSKLYSITEQRLRGVWERKLEVSGDGSFVTMDGKLKIDRRRGTVNRLECKTMDAETISKIIWPKPKENNLKF